MWKITKDFINDNLEECQVGSHSHDFDESKAIYKFQLFDDDDILYYEGVCDTNDDDNAFEPLDYYEADSGCTYIMYYDPSKDIWEVL